MEIILREDIPKLGNKGDVVKVRAGFARNYLLPRKLAIASTPGTLKQVEAMRASADRMAERDRGAAEEMAAKLAECDLLFTKRSGDQGQLFGSVTSSDIGEALAETGFTIDRRRLEMSEPLKHIGEFTVALRLHRDVVAEIKVKVAGEGIVEAPPPPEVSAPIEPLDSEVSEVADAEVPETTEAVEGEEAAPAPEADTAPASEEATPADDAAEAEAPPAEEAAPAEDAPAEPAAEPSGDTEAEAAIEPKAEGEPEK